MQVQVKFKRSGSNSVYGSFVSGDIMRVPAAVAEHFVKEGVARYTEQPAAPVEAAPEPTIEVKRGKRK